MLHGVSFWGCSTTKTDAFAGDFVVKAPEKREWVRTGTVDGIMNWSGDDAIDMAVAGRSLAPAAPTRLSAAGAHDPTPTPYRVLDDLVGGMGLDEGSHLLDVGCGLGRVLAYFVAADCPGRATGIELDEQLAAAAAEWSIPYDRISVEAGDVLEMPLAPYTHIYMYNPFDTRVLVAFLDKLEREARSPVKVAHMADNGEWIAYMGRNGWNLLREGTFEQAGADCPQHFSVRVYVPGA